MPRHPMLDFVGAVLLVGALYLITMALGWETGSGNGWRIAAGILAVNLIANLIRSWKRHRRPAD